MPMKELPMYVKLRDERTRVSLGVQQIEWVDYELQCDNELVLVLRKNEAYPPKAFADWYRLVSAKIEKRCGILLIPGLLQLTLGLPVRQVLLWGDGIYRLEENGQVTLKLL